MDWSLSLIAPEIILSVAAMLVLLIELPAHRRGREGRVAPVVAFLALAAAAILVWLQWGNEATSAFGGRYLIDAPALYLRALFILIGMAVLLMAQPYLVRENLPRFEFLSLLLFAIVGMMIMAAATEMVTLFLGLELLSMALYVMAGYQRGQERSVEAALKYFLLGAFGSAILLMGMALHWGATGSLQLHAIAPIGAGGTLLSPTMARAGFWLVIVGLAFKISVVPFHFWTADVYEGSPAPVAAFMATGTKAAAFAAILRLLGTGFAPAHAEWAPVLWWLAVLTMSVGNLMAIVQSNLKRMLAFSSVAHAGYLLIALVVGTEGAVRALFFYLVAYTLMNLGAFAVVGLVSRKGEQYASIYDYAGLARKQPWLAVLMAVFLFALAGIPPTVGFTGKLFIFTEAVRAGYVGLAVIAVINSLVSVYYYLRVIYLMTMKEEWEPTGAIAVPGSVALVLAFTFLMVLWLGVLPGGLLELAGFTARFF